jgi:K+-sensing histidine kinase KdpD
MRSTWAKGVGRNVNGYLFAVGGIAVVTAALGHFHREISSTTVALAFLLIVLFSATGWGIRPAMVASFLAVLCFNYFFLPPVYTWTITDPQNWVALAAFLITAITAGSLSARAKRRAEEAEARRREIERLYQGYRTAEERAKQAEVFEQSERLKSALLDAVTHDLRTPLTSIKASVTTLLAEVESNEPVALDQESRHEFLVVINEETDRLNRFVENLVELASIEAGAMHLRRRWVSVDEIITMARERARSLTKDHIFLLEIEHELPVARVDAALIAEVLYSLIDNATKYSPAGTPIRIIAERAQNEMIQFIIEDEGRGIAPELRARVFDKFFRATNEGASSLGRPKGLGMGLAIARGIVEAHGGRIWVESGKNGLGTRVAFVVPIGDEEPAKSDEISKSLSGNLSGISNE